MVTTKGLAGVILAIAFSKTGIKATDSNMGEKCQPKCLENKSPLKKMCCMSFLLGVFDYRVEWWLFLKSYARKIEI